ncbi:hypothetical protein L9F63_015682, partial [Diploptera punctata]
INTIYKTIMCDLAEDLNYDCNYNMFLIRTMMSSLPYADRTKVVSWMRKLASCNHSIDEMRTRNDFMYYLALNVQKGELKAPFTENPPHGPLPNMSQYLAGNENISAGPGAGGVQSKGTGGADWSEEMEQARAERPFIYQQSPDGGAFLAAQPIPRCGAFCYLAVISKTSEK